MTNSAEINYTAAAFANGTSATVPYPIGLQYFMFDTSGSHSYKYNQVQASTANSFDILFGASHVQITNLTGETLTGAILFNLALYAREPSDAISQSILLIEIPGYDNFPQIGTTGRIYVDTIVNNFYRWTGTYYAPWH